MINPRPGTRTLALLAVGLTTLAVTAGCGNGLETTSPGADPSVTQPTPVPSASPTAPTPDSSATDSPSATPSASPSREPEPSADPSTQTTVTVTPSATGGATSACTLGDLTVGVRASDGGAAAGSNYVLLTFRNKSGSTCTLYGYPGVSFVGKSNGTQLGVPAVRNRTASSSTVRLGAGKTTTALLQIVNAGNYDATQCAPTTSDGFRVYPPGSRSAAYVPFETQACQRDPGDSKQLTVTPVGTSG